MNTSCPNRSTDQAQVSERYIAESRNAQSHAGYINKLNIALKEADETEYWLELLHESETIDDKQFESIISDLKVIIGTLTKIIKKLKEKAKQ